MSKHAECVVPYVGSCRCSLNAKIPILRPALSSSTYLGGRPALRLACSGASLKQGINLMNQEGVLDGDYVE